MHCTVTPQTATLAHSTDICVLLADMGSPVPAPKATLALPIILDRAMFKGPWAAQYLQPPMPRTRTWYIEAAPMPSPVPVRQLDYTSDDEEDVGSLTVADYLLPTMAALGIFLAQAAVTLAVVYLT